MNLKQLFLTNNDCYKFGKKINVKGIMVHSTGANNPNLKRYVGPDDGLLGANVNNNHWNQPTPDGRQVCPHAFIGKLADGSIATYQTLPWDMEGWHGGSGPNGRVNDTHIGFEICEDTLADADYFSKIYQEAVELCVYLCKAYHIDPLQKDSNGGIICHSEGFTLGIASNHADVMHWFPMQRKDMDTFRADVKKTMEDIFNPKETDIVTQAQFNTMMDEWIRQQNAKPMSDWAKTELVEAKARGITDGTNPQGLATREQVAAMVLRAAKL